MTCSFFNPNLWNWFGTLWAPGFFHDAGDDFKTNRPAMCWISYN